MIKRKENQKFETQKHREHREKKGVWFQVFIQPILFLCSALCLCVSKNLNSLRLCSFASLRLIICYALIIFPIILCAGAYTEPWGKDAQLVHFQKEAPKPSQSKFRSPGQLVAEQVIRFHQTVITDVDGPRSHFRPTSSKYALDAIRKYGFLEGYLLSCDRLLRENPEHWVYRTKNIGNEVVKWDPVK